MTQSKSSDTQNKQSAGAETEADAKSVTGKANDDKSSHDAKSRIKAGSTEGAGGGAKQKQKH